MTNSEFRDKVKKEAEKRLERTRQALETSSNLNKQINNETRTMRSKIKEQYDDLNR